MSKLKTLFLMQVKEKIDFSFLKSKKQITFKVIFSILGFAVITALAYVVLYLCQMLNLFSAINHIPISVMSVIFFIMFVLNLLTCTVGLSKTLYYSKDNQILITYPVNANALFLSKMLVYYIYEVKKNFSFIIPVFFAYGLVSSLPFLYFIWFPIMITIFTLIPVLLGALLSFPIYFVLRFFNRFPVIKVILVMLILAGVIALVVLAINAIPEDINLIRSWSIVSQAIRDFLEFFSEKFFIFYAITIFLCGRFEGMTSVLFTEYSYIVLLIMLATILVLVGLNYLISRPLYLKMASKQFEFDAGKGIKHTNVVRKGFLSSCVYETRKALRDTNIFSTTLATIIIAPISILLLNTIYAAINTRMMGDYLAISFNILIILLFALAHNINVSNIYSKDGEANILNKTKPCRPIALLLPYLFYNFVSSTLIVVASTSVFLVNTTLDVGSSILVFFIILFLVYTHLIWSAEIDFLHPRNIKSQSNINQNEVKSILLTFAISLIAFGLTLFFLIDGMGGVWLKLFFVALAFLAIRCWLFQYKVRVLFKEI